MEVNTTLNEWVEYPLSTHETAWYIRKWITETALGPLSIYEYSACDRQHTILYNIYMPGCSKQGFPISGGTTSTLEQAKEEAQKNFNSFVEQKFAIHNKR